jgi:GT2 family glycosyltransferase
LREVDWVQGSAMFVKKEIIDKIGLMDEKFFMYFEDADWCRRFRKAGYKVVYFPEAQMSHYYHRASKKWGFLLDVLFNKYTRIHILSGIKYFSKWKNHENQNKE